MSGWPLLEAAERLYTIDPAQPLTTEEASRRYWEMENELRVLQNFFRTQMAALRTVCTHKDHNGDTPTAVDSVECRYFCAACGKEL